MERALLELNLRRETWCQVETDPRQAWRRTERRHYRSPPPTSPLPAGEQRGAGRMTPPPPAERPERRHFEQSYKAHLV